MISIDSRSNKPIYEQIIDGIKENILKGIMKPGDKLPSVREMSAIITANPNTVSKAYMELGRSKVIETIRGRGTYVAENYKPKIDEDKVIHIRSTLKNVVIEAHYMGIDKKQIVSIIEDIYTEMEGKNHDKS